MGNPSPAQALTLSLWIGLGNTLAPLVAWWLLRTWRFSLDFRTFRDVWLLFAAAGIAALVSAINGSAALVGAGTLPASMVPTVLATWWIGDCLGFIGFAPCLILRPANRAVWQRLILPLTATVVVTLVVGWDPLGLQHVMPVVWLSLLPLVWLGAWGGPHAVATGYVIVAVGLVLATNAGYGALASKVYGSPLVALSCFLAVGALLAHLLGVWSQQWQRLLGEAQARAEADERFRILFDQAPDAHLLLGDQGITTANHAAAILLGYERSALLDRHPADLGQPRQPDGTPSVIAWQELADIATDQGYVRAEWRHRRPDGRELPIEVCLTPVRLEERPVLLVVLYDLTERKIAEAAVRRARDEAEAALRAKSDFLATMSHELRTPLNGVIGMASLLKRTQLAADQRDQVDTIHGCAVHLLTLINDILDLSRLEAGKVPLECIPCDIRRLAREVAAMLEPKAAERGLRFGWTATEAVPDAVRTNPVRVRQILINLLGNAVKFTDQGDVTLHLDWQDDRLVATIRDTGIGMDAATVTKLFQPFTQADASMARRYGGSGLGLAISRRLTDLLEGRLEVQSALGQGTTFTLSLPVEPCAAPDRTTDLHRAISRTRRVLLVEDNLVNRKVGMLMLKTLGHTVEVAEDGQQALDRLAQERFDVVLMDCQMPVLDGLEATRQLRQRGDRIPVIALTANALEGDREICLDAGMDGYLSKPVTPEALAAALDTLRG